MFYLEDRYIVIKRSRLAQQPVIVQEELKRLLAKIDTFDFNALGNSTLQCIVLESDWPEFKLAKDALERRVNGESICKMFTGVLNNQFNWDPSQQELQMMRAISNWFSSKMQEAREVRNRPAEMSIQRAKEITEQAGWPTGAQQARQNTKGAQGGEHF